MTFPAQGRFKNKLFPHYLISQARKKFNSRKCSNDKNEAKIQEKKTKQEEEEEAWRESLSKILE